MRAVVFNGGLRMLKTFPDMPLERLIAVSYPIEQAPAAFAHAGRPNALKILIDMQPGPSSDLSDLSQVFEKEKNDETEGTSGHSEGKPCST